MEKKIKIEVSERLASCLQRMLVEEINNQFEWKKQDRKWSDVRTLAMRDGIIAECENLQEELEKQGFKKYFKCY